MSKPRNYIMDKSCSITFHRHFATHVAAATEKKSKKMLFYLTGLVFAMVGCSNAAVPLYRRFCQATGYSGTVQQKESVEEKIARHSKNGTITAREIIVQFNADVADGMPWKFLQPRESYAAVPLYRRFCQATGYGGTVQRKESVEGKIARHSKDGTVTARLPFTSTRYNAFALKNNDFFLANRLTCQSSFI